MLERFVLLALITSIFLTPFTMCHGYELDLFSIVTDVIDGDSFYIEGDEVRLADVSCPEWNEYGGPEATQALTTLIEGQSIYLDTSKPWSKTQVSTYTTSLNDYFKQNPSNWFDSFEPILNGMYTSYYPNTEHNTALHTDLCSPFATDIIWSKLSVRYRNVLRSNGVRIWHRLVEILKPDIIMLSVARKYLSLIRFRKSTWKKHTSILSKKDGSPRSKPCDIEVAKSQIVDKKGYLVYGEAAQKPFGTLSTGYKEIVGERLLDLFD